MGKDKMRVESVYYRVYYKQDNMNYYTDPEYNSDDAMEHFKIKKADADYSDVRLVRVIELNETIAE